MYSKAVMTLKRQRKVVMTGVTGGENVADSIDLDLSKKHHGRREQRKAVTGIDAFYPAVLRDLERIGDHSHNIVQYFDDL